MKKVLIKYNPYKLETVITVDGKGLAQNSKLGEKSAEGSRLQEWIEGLPQILVEEYNDTDFEVLFHGTLLDYEDLVSAFTDAHNAGKLTAKIERKPAKETADKEALINDVFTEIQRGPFDELRDEQIINAFQNAKSSDFEVCVVATMSSGKSTLINAMLGTKLMPSKQEACTAIITRIKDISDSNKSFKAEVYDDDGHLMETQEHLTLPVMERLNADKKVSVINMEGNIPFVDADEISLVLIDTPGPNNSRDPNHLKTQSKFLGQSSKALILYIMTGEFGTDDDNNLLKRVAESMAVGGKQSKDRFIFVINKLDDRKKEDGETNQTLEKVKAYLKNHGINNPNLFPAAALPALNIRMIMNGADVDEDAVDETEIKVKRLNRNETLHFETYAALPASIRGEIKNQLEEARTHDNGLENQHEALIHTGIVSIEAAIRQYVRKYAKTAKIKNIVDTFSHKLDEVGCFEETKRELAQNREESARIVKQIDSIREKINSAGNVKKFKTAVDSAVVKVMDDSKGIVEDIIAKFQSTITKRIDALRGEELELDDVEDEVKSLEKFAKKLEPEFEEQLDELIRSNLVNTSNALLEEYKNKLASLTEEIDMNNLVGVKIEPLKLMGGSFELGGFSTKKLVKTKKIEDGEEWVQNTDKKWYKPWTWFQESGYYRTKYKQVKYVPGNELADEFFKPVQQTLHENGQNAVKYAKQQSGQITDRFAQEFKRLDDTLKSKLDELESYATDKEKADERIKESERRLDWLENIKAKVDSILEI